MSDFTQEIKTQISALQKAGIIGADDVNAGEIDQIIAAVANIQQGGDGGFQSLLAQFAPPAPPPSHADMLKAILTEGVKDTLDTMFPGTPAPAVAELAVAGLSMRVPANVQLIMQQVRQFADAPQFRLQSPPHIAVRRMSGLLVAGLAARLSVITQQQSAATQTTEALRLIVQQSPAISQRAATVIAKLQREEQQRQEALANQRASQQAAQQSAQRTAEARAAAAAKPVAPLPAPSRQEPDVAPSERFTEIGQDVGQDVEKRARVVEMPEEHDGAEVDDTDETGGGAPIQAHPLAAAEPAEDEVKDEPRKKTGSRKR